MVYLLNSLVGNSLSFLSSLKLYQQGLVLTKVSQCGILEENKH
jgi:hypothetical protein